MMLEKLFDKIIKNQKGAMDKVIVTLILVIISVSAMIGLSSWIEGQEDAVKSRAETVLEEAKNG